MESLTEWIHAELNARSWDNSDLARAAGIQPATISRILSGTRNAGPDVCRAIAHGLRVPPEQVFRLAGLLPPEPAPVSDEREALSLFRRLPETARQLILTQLRALAGAQPRPSYTVGAVREPPTPDPYQTDPLTTELLHQFQQLPEHWQQEAIREMQRLQRYADNQVRIIGDPDDTP